MIKKINYTSEWVDISKAISIFEDLQSFIDAAAEEKIKTRGKIIDSRGPEVSESYTDVPPNKWNDFIFEEHNCSLNDTNYMHAGGVSRDYHQIQVKKADLLLWIFNQRYSGNSNELQEAIKKVFIELYIENAFLNLPSANDVYNRLESIQKDMPFITKFDRNKDGEKAIWWKTADGNNTSMAIGRFKNLLTPIRKQIKELENLT